MTAAEDPSASSAAEDEGAAFSSGAPIGSSSAERMGANAALLREPLERLAAALEQLERLAAVEEQLLRESVRVTRQAAAALPDLVGAPTLSGPAPEAEPFTASVHGEPE